MLHSVPDREIQHPTTSITLIPTTITTLTIRCLYEIHILTSERSILEIKTIKEFSQGRNDLNNEVNGTVFRHALTAYN
jgi:hypothetical protein